MVHAESEDSEATNLRSPSLTDELWLNSVRDDDKPRAEMLEVSSSSHKQKRAIAALACAHHTLPWPMTYDGGDASDILASDLNAASHIQHYCPTAQHYWETQGRKRL